MDKTWQSSYQLIPKENQTKFWRISGTLPAIMKKHFETISGNFLPNTDNRGLSERQFLHSSTGESNTSCWVFHKQMVESFQTLAQYWKPIQNLGTKIWHHLKNNILSMVMLKLWANLSPSYVKSWLNVKLFIISCCLAVQEVLCSPAVEGHKPG